MRGLRFLRKHLVATALVAALAASAIEVVAVGTDPAPQGPPSGVVLYAGQAELRWSRGTRGGEIRLQVSPGDPGFSAPSIDEVAKGTGRKLDGLRAGEIYYWRLVRDGDPGPVMKLAISRDALGL